MSNILVKLLKLEQFKLLKLLRVSQNCTNVKHVLLMLLVLLMLPGKLKLLKSSMIFFPLSITKLKWQRKTFNVVYTVVARPSQFWFRVFFPVVESSCACSNMMKNVVDCTETSTELFIWWLYDKELV